MKQTWGYLYQKEFISAKKYERLIRKDEFGTNELASFIERQLVETSQSTKAVAQIMKRLYSDSNIVYVKAENVSDYRHKMNFIKVRDINDLHHAKDAYLNIVVGNIFEVKFTNTPANYVKQAGYREYNLDRMYDFKVERAGYIAWDGRNGHSMKMVNSQMRSNDVRITRRAVDQKGQLFKQTIYKKEICKPNSYMGVKTGDLRLSDVNKYGGFTSIKIAYFIPYSCTIINKKGIKRNIKRLIDIPIYLENSTESAEGLSEYILKKIPIKLGEKIEDFKIIKLKLRIGSLIKYQGFYYYVGGKSGNSFYADNAVQLILNDDYSQYIKKINKFLTLKKDNNKIELKDSNDKFTREYNNELYNVLVEKLNSRIYRKSTNNKYYTLVDKEIKEKFCKLGIEEQIDILLNVLNMLTNKASVYDFEMLDFGLGRRKLGFDITKVSEFKLINQSITGLFENSIDLLS
ncbi:MAG TPA: hypothetical protein GX695_04895 [Acholeplasmataceae bacterium]|nr:hypothetical protein [Acholeplasmataceae bacterium]